MNQVIAERKLILEDIQTKERRNLTIRIGLPIWDEVGQFARCAIEYDGLLNNIADVRAMDTLLALEIASNVDTMLIGYIKKYNFYWEDGEPYDVKAHLEDQINILKQEVVR